MNMDFKRRHGRAGRAGGWLFAIAALTLPLAQSASAAAERSLAGIRIFSRQNAVLAKYGNPSQVIVGGQSTTVLGGGAGGGSGAPAGGGFGGGGGGYPGGGGGGYPGGGGGGGYPGGGGGYPGGGALPGFGGGAGAAPGEFGGGGGKGLGGFGAGGEASGGFGGGGGGVASATSSKEYTWVYDRPDGSSLEFTFSSDGRVVQIRATGFKANVRTLKGVALGMPYSSVVSRYGSPESQSVQGAVLNANYSERNHAAFQFVNSGRGQKLVGIIVAAVQ